MSDLIMFIDNITTRDNVMLFIPIILVVFFFAFCTFAITSVYDDKYDKTFTISVILLIICSLSLLLSFIILLVKGLL